MMKLTEKQSEVLDFIKGFIIETGYPPSIREIMNEFNISSTNGARTHLMAIQKKGYIKVDAGVSRGIRVLAV